MITLFLDPGQTTGWCIFNDEEFHSAGQLDNGLVQMWTFLQEISPDRIVSESFHLYGHKSGSKTNSSFPEIEVIGVIRLWAQLNNKSHIEQSASQAKLYGTDELLKELDLWQRNKKHANDSLRHACLLFRLRKML